VVTDASWQIIEKKGKQKKENKLNSEVETLDLLGGCGPLLCMAGYSSLLSIQDISKINSKLSSFQIGSKPENKFHLQCTILQNQKLIP
jgi:hypothetical protein